MFLVEYFKKSLSWKSQHDRLSYEAVDSGSDSDNVIIMGSETKSASRRRPDTNVVFCRRAILVCLSIASLVLLCSFLYQTGISYGTRRIAKYTCGSTPTEARQNDCFFDPMMSAWIPSTCYFDALAQEYGDIFTTWGWFWDANHTQAITSAAGLAQVRAGNYTKIWTDYPHAHDLHCIYTWRKMALTLERNLLRLDARSLDFDHSVHCARTIGEILEGRDPMAGALYVTVWPMMYHDCLPIEKRFA